MCSTASVVVSANVVSSLSYSTQPGGSVMAGSAFTTQPIVLATDTYGNVISSAIISLSAFTDNQCTNAGAVSLNNPSQTTSGSGVATFTSLSYNRSETVFVKATAGIVWRSS